MIALAHRQTVSPAYAPSSGYPLHEAIAASFALDDESVLERLAGFSETQWARALLWLDVSGLALYFLHHLRQLRVESILPPSVEVALAGRMLRNRARMRRLVDEGMAMAASFEDAGIPYAMLKGITLAPDSVADIGLRSQADLDFLVPRDRRDDAVGRIFAAGYQLKADNGASLEFRAAAFDSPSLARLYSAHAPRALDLHLVADHEVHTRLFARRVRRPMHGATICALAAADILVQQARHLLQHLCSEFTRLSWVLEFRRHVVARSSEVQFWREAAESAAQQENGDLAMAVAFWLARDLFGPLPVEVPVQWNAGALLPRVRLWLELYARQVLLHPGLRTKLYALLRTEVPCAAHEKRSTRAILFPRCLPRRVMDRPPVEGLWGKLCRTATEMRLFLQRLRFHVKEGIRLGIEVPRWKRAQARVSQ